MAIVENTNGYMIRAVLVMVCCAGAMAEAAAPWKPVAEGVEYAELPRAPGSTDIFQVVRIDPTRAELKAMMASAGGKARTASEWCDSAHLVAAINLGMYLDDHLSNVGYARSGSHLNQKRWLTKYQSVLAFGPRRKDVPAAVMVDLDTPGARAKLDDYNTVIQNLRLVRAPGKGAWGPQPRRWSEAAVAIDRSGRVLFVLARVPHSMNEFNQILLGLPLEVVNAMHVEGGPEASLSLRGHLRLDANGSFETGFNENDGVAQQWEIPNVLGVVAVKKP